MTIVEVTTNNEMQVILLPEEMRFSAGIKRIMVRRVGEDRVLSPIKNTWNSFFLANDNVSDDMAERESQNQTERDLFDN